MQPTCRHLILLPMFLIGASSPPVLAASELFDHEPWADVLRRFVDEQGLVDYAGLAADRASLDRYLAAIESTSPKSHPQLFPTLEHQLAYYINAYNALVFQGVLDLGPDATTVWGKLGTGYGFFVKTKVVLGGRRTNLRKLENQDIRKGFEDPRIHAALNCASAGCPRLPQEVFAAESLDQQLDAAMAEFVADARHCVVDSAAGTVSLSKIFDWFRSDFEDFEALQGTSGNLMAYVNRYRVADAQIPGDFKVRFLPYDKGLNHQ
ncbi:MAG: DUF547 domain-containing protein [Acidobacteriota bacterium]